MRTVKWNYFLAATVACAASFGLSTPAKAVDVTSTGASAILLYPKLVANTDAGVDTYLQLTNVSSQPANVRCFYINANGHCSSSPATVCDPNRPSGSAANTCPDSGACIPGWNETDFRFTLTPNQPIAWRLSTGMSEFPLANQPGPNGHFNVSSSFLQSSIPPSSEDPFFGSLTCVLVGEDEYPLDRNWLQGKATIVSYSTGPDSIDSAGYNAIGIQAYPHGEGHNREDNVLILGGDNPEYAGCPGMLSLDHLFSGAEDPVSGDTVNTDVTFIPCSVDFNLQLPKSVVVQFLVFNEFEQRMSTSRTVECLTNLPMTDIDTRIGPSGDAQSIFSVSVQGTLAGQTLARGVNDDSATAPGGEAILMVAQRFNSYNGSSVSAIHVPHHRASRTQPDIIVLPGAAPPSLPSDQNP